MIDYVYAQEINTAATPSHHYCADSGFIYVNKFSLEKHWLRYRCDKKKIKQVEGEDTGRLSCIAENNYNLFISQ